MWSGPVGLAETNSTLTFRALAAFVRPQPAGLARTSATSPSSAGVGEPEVQEARRGDGGAPEDGAFGAGGSVEFGCQGFGDPEGRHPVRAGELHGEVAGEVAVIRVGRALDLEGGPGGLFDSREGPRGDGTLPRRGQFRAGAGPERRDGSGGAGRGRHGTSERGWQVRPW